MADLDDIAKTLGMDSEDGFVIFMGRVDDAIEKRVGFGVFDFADADWGALFEDEPDCDEQAMFDTLSEADDTFAAMLAL